jgi:two-component system invasion response regulator UvrY
MVGEATSGEDVQRPCQECQPDGLMLDLRMPRPTALETMAYGRRHCPETRVLMLTALDDEAHRRGPVEAGVDGYLLKAEVPTTMSDAIRVVAASGTWFCQSMAEKLVIPSNTTTLTDRA